MRRCARSEWDRGNAYFGPTSFQISNIHAGTGANNVVPGALEVTFNFRFSPESPVGTLTSRVQAVLDGQGLDYELVWTVNAEPFLTPAGRLVEAVRSAVASVTGVDAALSTSGGTSDGRFLATLAREVVEFGPLNESIHKIDERIAVADLWAAVDDLRAGGAGAAGDVAEDGHEVRLESRTPRKTSERTYLLQGGTMRFARA